MRTKNGFVPGIKLLQVLGDVGTSVLETKKRNTIYVNNLHKVLGHCGEVNARLTGKAYGYEVTGKFDRDRILSAENSVGVGHAHGSSVAVCSIGLKIKFNSSIVSRWNDH